MSPLLQLRQQQLQERQLPTSTSQALVLLLLWQCRILQLWCVQIRVLADFAQLAEVSAGVLTERGEGSSVPA